MMHPHMTPGKNMGFAIGACFLSSENDAKLIEFTTESLQDITLQGYIGHATLYISCRISFSRHPNVMF